MPWEFLGDVPVEGERDRARIVAEYLRDMRDSKGWRILAALMDEKIAQEHARLETCAPDHLAKIQGRLEGMKMVVVMVEEKIREGT